LRDAASADFPDPKSRPWYMEKYVFILELLVSKNLDKLDREMTKDLLSVFVLIEDVSYFNKMMFYKLLKILAHLHFLKDMCDKEYEFQIGIGPENKLVLKQGVLLEKILTFMNIAYHNTKDQLSFLFIMKVMLLITKDFDGNTLGQHSDPFKKMMEECFTFLDAHYLEHTEKLTLEILLYLVNFFKQML
jgi:hypothetical protein